MTVLGKNVVVNLSLGQIDSLIIPPPMVPFSRGWRDIRKERSWIWEVTKGQEIYCLQWHHSWGEAIKVFLMLYWKPHELVLCFLSQSQEGSPFPVRASKPSEKAKVGHSNSTVWSKNCRAKDHSSGFCHQAWVDNHRTSKDLQRAWEWTLRQRPQVQKRSHRLASWCCVCPTLTIRRGGHYI